MDETAYDFEAATWYDIENNKMHLKKEGEHYVADAMLFRDNLNLRQENESLKKENDRLRKERDHWHVEQVHAYGNWEDAHKRASELENENAKLHELADAVKEFVEDSHCEDCSSRRDCDDNNRIFCADDFSYHAFAAMRKLGIEVTNG